MGKGGFPIISKIVEMRKTKEGAMSLEERQLQLGIKREAISFTQDMAWELKEGQGDAMTKNIIAKIGEGSQGELELYLLKYEHTYKKLKEKKKKKEEIESKISKNKKEYYQLKLNLSFLDEEISCLEEEFQYLSKLLSKEHEQGRPKCSYWWRKYLKTKVYYQIPEEGDRGIVREIMFYFRWMGDWTLNVWWNRVPSRTLWEFALEVVKVWGRNKRSSKLFLIVLSSIAERFKEFKDFRIWKNVKDELPRWAKYPKLSLKLLLFLLRRCKEKLERVLRQEFFEIYRGFSFEVVGRGLVCHTKLKGGCYG